LCKLSLTLNRKERRHGSNCSIDVLVETLIDWGVKVVFGLPGDGINGIMEALRKRQNDIRFIQVRHEEAAAFMACGYAKYTGKLGVCLATSGPGGIHLLNGLYDAKMDGQPVLAITGHHYHDLIDTYAQQDVDLWEQMVFLGNPEYGCELHPINFAAFARACGGSGFTIDDPKDCGRILD
jgi:thiamine pyrophosphate-dependent acetolactate synthase large subunit-like protein